MMLPTLMITCCLPKFHRRTMPAPHKTLNCTRPHFNIGEMVMLSTTNCHHEYKKVKSVLLSFCLSGMALIKLLMHILRHQHITCSLTSSAKQPLCSVPRHFLAVLSQISPVCRGIQRLGKVK